MFADLLFPYVEQFHRGINADGIFSVAYILQILNLFMLVTRQFFFGHDVTWEGSKGQK